MAEQSNIVGSAQVEVTAAVNEAQFETAINAAVEKLKARINAELHLTVAGPQGGTAAPAAPVATARGKAADQGVDANVGAVTGINTAIEKALAGQQFKLPLNLGDIRSSVQAALTEPFHIKVIVDNVQGLQSALSTGGAPTTGAAVPDVRLPAAIGRSIEANKLGDQIDAFYSATRDAAEKMGRAFGRFDGNSTGNSLDKLQDLIGAFGSDMTEWTTKTGRKVTGGRVIDTLQQWGISDPNVVKSVATSARYLQEVSAGGLGGSQPLSALVRENAAAFAAPPPAAPAPTPSVAQVQTEARAVAQAVAQAPAEKPAREAEMRSEARIFARQTLDEALQSAQVGINTFAPGIVGGSKAPRGRRDTPTTPFDVDPNTNEILTGEQLLQRTQGQLPVPLSTTGKFSYAQLIRAAQSGQFSNRAEMVDARGKSTGEFITFDPSDTDNQAVKDLLAGRIANVPGGRARGLRPTQFLEQLVNASAGTARAIVPDEDLESTRAGEPALFQRVLSKVISPAASAFERRIQAVKQQAEVGKRSGEFSGTTHKLQDLLAADEEYVKQFELLRDLEDELTGSVSPRRKSELERRIPAIKQRMDQLVNEGGADPGAVITAQLTPLQRIAALRERRESRVETDRLSRERIAANLIPGQGGTVDPAALAERDRRAITDLEGSPTGVSRATTADQRRNADIATTTIEKLRRFTEGVLEGKIAVSAENIPESHRELREGESLSKVPFIRQNIAAIVDDLRVQVGEKPVGFTGRIEVPNDFKTIIGPAVSAAFSTLAREPIGTGTKTFAETDRVSRETVAARKEEVVPTGDEIRAATGKTAFVAAAEAPRGANPEVVAAALAAGGAGGGGGGRTAQGGGFSDIHGPIHVIVDNVPLQVAFDGAAPSRGGRGVGAEEAAIGGGAPGAARPGVARSEALGSRNARRAALGLEPLLNDITSDAANQADEERARLAAVSNAAQRRILRRGFTASVTDILQAPAFEGQVEAVNKFNREAGQLGTLLTQQARAVSSYNFALQEEGAAREKGLPNIKAYEAATLHEAQVRDQIAKQVEAQQARVRTAQGNLPGVGAAVGNLAIGGLAAAGAFGLGSIVFQFAGQALQLVEQGIGQVIGPEVEKAFGFRGVEGQVGREAGAALRATPDLTQALAQSALASGLTAQALTSLGPALGNIAQAEAGNAALSEQIRIQRAARAASLEETRTAAGAGGGLFQPAGGIPGITRSTGGFLGSPLNATPSLFEQLAGNAGVSPLNSNIASFLDAIDRQGLDLSPGGLATLPLVAGNAALGALGQPKIGSSITSALGLEGQNIEVSPQGILGAAGRAVRLPAGSPEQAIAFQELQVASDRFAELTGTLDDFDKALDKTSTGFDLLRGNTDKTIQQQSDLALRRAGVDSQLVSVLNANRVAFTKPGGGAIETREDVKALGEQILKGLALQDPQQFINANRLQIQARIGREDQQRNFTLGTIIPQQSAISQALQPIGNIAAPLRALGVDNLGSLPGLLSRINAETRSGITQARDFVSGTLGSTAGQQFGDALQKAADYGERISRLQIGVQTQQAALSAAQYSYQIYQVNRSLQDAKGLTGQITEENGRNLGVIERQQFLLQRQSQELAFQLQQRQINYQVALAGFVAPGQTSEERAARIKEAEKEAEYAQKQLDIQKQLFGLQGRGFRISAGRQVEDLTRQLGLLERGREVELNTAKADAKIRALTALQDRENKKVSTFFDAAVQRTGDIMDLEADLVTATGRGLAEVTRLAINAFEVTYSGIIDALTGGGSSGRSTGSFDTRSGGSHGHARGVLMTTTGAYNMTVGEAGDETVAVLRNPRPASGLMPFGGGIGTKIDVGGITVVVPASTSRGDAEQLAKVITRLVEENLSRRLTLLGGQRSLT